MRMRGVSASLGAKRCDHLKRRAQRLSGFQGAQAGGLDGRAVGHRIGERHAELDDVRAGRWESAQDLEGRVGVGISRHDEGDERGPTLGGKPLESAVNA